MRKTTPLNLVSEMKRSWIQQNNAYFMLEVKLLSKQVIMTVFKQNASEHLGVQMSRRIGKLSSKFYCHRWELKVEGRHVLMCCVFSLKPSCVHHT